ncbi:predicted protein [Brucella ceti B1/94]|nr:predicted protein [Brucella ceti B1/94]EEZ08254.1 predicted protein [Brucella ceti M490/95/1]
MLRLSLTCLSIGKIVHMGQGDSVDNRLVAINIVCPVCQNAGEGGKTRDHKADYCKPLKQHDCPQSSKPVCFRIGAYSRVPELSLRVLFMPRSKILMPG